MESSGQFADYVKEISLRAVFKGKLLEILDAFYIWTNGATADVALGLDVPLSHSVPGEKVCYTSAIAPMLAAKMSFDAVLLAHQLAAIQPQLLCSHTTHLSISNQAIAKHIHIEVNRQGWLILTLSDTGIVTWLEALNATQLLPSTLEPLQSSLSNELPLPFPLCEHLQVSWPMLMGWAHTRCVAWISHLKVTASPETDWLSWQKAQLRGDLVSKAPPPDSPMYHPVLKALIRALDMLAKSPESINVMLQQGYCIAEAIYAFDATTPTMSIQMLHPQLKPTVMNLLQGTQTVLTLIFSRTCTERPSKTL